jgi:hypothetical protein
MTSCSQRARTFINSSSVAGKARGAACIGMVEFLLKLLKRAAANGQ